MSAAWQGFENKGGSQVSETIEERMACSPFLLTWKPLEPDSLNRYGTVHSLQRQYRSIGDGLPQWGFIEGL